LPFDVAVAPFFAPRGANNRPKTKEGLEALFCFWGRFFGVAKSQKPKAKSQKPKALAASGGGYPHQGSLIGEHVGNPRERIYMTLTEHKKPNFSIYEMMPGIAREPKNEDSRGDIDQGQHHGNRGGSTENVPNDRCLADSGV